MNSYNFMRSFNAFSCSNRIFDKKAIGLRQPLIRHINFMHEYFFSTSILRGTTRVDNGKTVLFLSNSYHTLSTNSNSSSLLINLKSSTCQMYPLTSIIKSSVDDKHFSTEPEKKSPDAQLTRKEQLKRAVKEYGSTVIIFHVTISLMSLGVCYLLVSSGIDMENILSSLGISGSVVANAGTFVTAYAIHKVFAPVRISITLGTTPFIVRYLRRTGFLKVPKKS